MDIAKLKHHIDNDGLREKLLLLYGASEEKLAYQKNRYEDALFRFSKNFPMRKEAHIYSAPGRTEIGGNHTDHQNGAILAGAVDLDAVGVVAFHSEGVVRIASKNYETIEISLNDISDRKKGKGSEAIVRGILTKFIEKGIDIGGFDMYSTSDVLKGGGISSSAAFEILICTVINCHYNDSKDDPFELAKIGCFAENEYFGKKCGLLDQTVSSFGGLVGISFANPEAPATEQISFDFEKAGYYLCLTDTKSSHEHLTDEYVAIRNEMKQIAKHFGCDVLNTVNETDFYDNIKELRSKYGDRAVLRSIHFFDETKRAKEETEALKRKDINRFLALVNESGDSSWKLLQNNYCITTPHNQEIPLAITLTKKVLCGDGAVRVHGGGFAGTVQAFVPIAKVAEYRETMEKVFGEGSVYVLRIRPVGGIQII